MKILKIFLLCFVALFADEFNLNYKDGAVQNFTNLNKNNEIILNLKDDVPATGLDYDESSDSFIVGTRALEIYEFNGDFSKQKGYLKSTKDWIIQLEDGVATSYFNGSIGIISYNKTYEFFKSASNQSKEEANKAWRYLLDGYENYTLDFKDRYYTIRAKQQYILSWDYSPFYAEFFVASVPDDIKQSWSIASFSDEDNMLSTEFIPKFDETLKVKENRDISDYYITGMDASGEYIYLLSKQYSSILKLDPRTRKVVEVLVFDGIFEPHALALKDDKFYILSRDSGKNKVVILTR